MKRKGWLAKILLLPLSCLYGTGVVVRNWLFDFKILKEKEFDIPTIGVGNLCIGGTGKTPHVEYVVGQLRHSFHLAVLSRGYKRSTSGFVMATKRSTPADIGDEPYQIYHKYGCEVPVAVCEDRVSGISELLRIDPRIDLVVLDDAFQHRYVKTTVSILLTEYNRPYFEDTILPYGHLREPRSGAHRADIVVATKCPEKITALDYRIFEENLGKLPFQSLFFSKFVYGKLMPVFPDIAPSVAPSLDWLSADDMVLAVAGISNPKPFVRFIKHFKAKVRVNIFPDHHSFSKKDTALLQNRFDTMEAKRKFLITTEKDAVRMINCPYFPHDLKPYVYYLPVQVEMMRGEAQTFIESVRRLIKAKRPQTKQ